MKTHVWLLLFGLLAGVLGLGCVTNDPSVIGSQAWYEQRTTEIQAAYEAGDLSTEEYLRLKNEADRIRVDYRRGYSRAGVSLGVGYYHRD